MASRFEFGLRRNETGWDFGKPITGWRRHPASVSGTRVVIRDGGGLLNNVSYQAISVDTADGTFALTGMPEGWRGAGTCRRATTDPIGEGVRPPLARPTQPATTEYICTRSNGSELTAILTGRDVIFGQYRAQIIDREPGFVVAFYSAPDGSSQWVTIDREGSVVRSFTLRNGDGGPVIDQGSCRPAS